jgi:hypothetical protein
VLGNNGIVMADPIEQFNQHQTDVKHRFNFLVQSVLLLAGGALTASIAVFTGSRTIELSSFMSKVLGFSWWSLVSSICLAVICVLIVILRDYYLGERWRKALSDPSMAIDDSPGLPDKALIVCGLTSIFAFLSGFIAIAVVATNVVVA